MNFFQKRHTANTLLKARVATAADLSLLTEIQSLNVTFKNRLAEESADPTSSTCCSKCISFFQKITIPDSYKSVLSWLAAIAEKQIQAKQVNEAVTVSALDASVAFVSQNAVGNPIAAKVLDELIDEIAKQFNLNITADPDYPTLVAYCNDNGIAIPAVLDSIVNAPTQPVDPATQPAAFA